MTFLDHDSALTLCRLFGLKVTGLSQLYFTFFWKLQILWNINFGNRCFVSRTRTKFVSSYIDPDNRGSVTLTLIATKQSSNRWKMNREDIDTKQKENGLPKGVEGVEENLEDLTELECKKQHLYNIFLFFLVIVFEGIQLYLLTKVLMVNNDLIELVFIIFLYWWCLFSRPHFLTKKFVLI